MKVGQAALLPVKLAASPTSKGEGSGLTGVVLMGVSGVETVVEATTLLLVASVDADVAVEFGAAMELVVLEARGSCSCRFFNSCSS